MPDDHRPALSGVPQSPVEPRAARVPAGEGDVPAQVSSPGHAPGRIRRSASQARRRLEAERIRLQEELNTSRQRSGMVDAGFQLQELDSQVGGGILAGALAFRIFLFMVPFVYVVFTVLGSASGALSQDPAQLARDLGITGVLASAVVKAQDQSAWTLAVLVAGAAVALFLTAGSLLKALYVVHWLIWRVPRVMPTGLVPRLILIGFTLAASALGVAINDVRNSSGAAGVVIAIVVIAACSFALWWRVSWKLPHPPVPARALIPGALLMAVGADVLHLLTTYWIGHLVARKTSTYGSVGIALAVLLWVYILGRIIVASAGLNAALYRRQNR
jgi:membrane protein